MSLWLKRAVATRCAFSLYSLRVNDRFMLLQNRSVTSRAKKHRIFLKKYAKGYRGRSKNCFRIAIRRVHKAWQNAYKERKLRKRNFRRLWIQRIGAAVRQYGMNYSRFINTQSHGDCRLNRKVLADLAANEPFSFKSVLTVVQKVAPAAKT